MAEPSDLLLARRLELERRLAALAPERRAQLEQDWKLSPGGISTIERPTIPRRANIDVAPMSYSQEMLWLLERTNPGHAYNVPRVTRLRGALDREALRAALDALVERHEALRTTFDVVGDRPSQIVHPPTPAGLTMIDLAGLASDAREAEARRHVVAIVSTPLDLQRDSLFRATLLGLAPDDHVLVILSHHIVSDGWSGNILLRELGILYNAFVHGITPTLPPLPLQFADFATWQREQLDGDRLAGLLGYWSATLAGAPPPLDLPVDRPRGTSLSFEGAGRSRLLSPETLAGVRAMASAHGATPFMVYLAVLQTLLHRYSGESDLVIGSPVAGRMVPELEPVVGFFANTIMLRTAWSGALSFSELLQRARATTLGAFDHQDLPLERLLMERDPTGAPLAAAPRVMIVTDDPDRQPFTLPGLERAPFGAARGAAKGDLTLHVAEQPGGLRIGFSYRTDLFDAPSIDRMLGHFEALLNGALAAPNAALGELPLLTPAEYQQLIVDWNATHAPLPDDQTLHGLVNVQVARTPDAVAVAHGRETITYAELRQRISMLANRLRAAGVSPGVFVGVCIERSIDLVAAVLAVLEAGGAYVPLDPAYPSARLEFMVEDVDAPVLVTSTGMRARLPWLNEFAAEANRAVLDLDETTPVPAGLPLPARPVAPDDVAYVIYTSGSTGRPKAVLIEHRNAVAFVVWALRAFTQQDFAGVLASTSISFDLSVFELFATLAAGGTVVLAADALALGKLESTQPVTLVNTVPSAIRELLRAGEIPASVRTINLAGELLPQQLVDELYALPDLARVNDLYGPSETTTYSTWCIRRPGGTASVGKPIANTAVYVLDAARRPVPIGVPGELFIGGAGVARGYHQRADLTAERFLQDPFAGHQPARMYRTGDRVRWRADGELELLGRLDTQVKLRGHRIELGEVESALRGQQGVDDAVVIVREDTPGDQRLVGYVVLAGPADPTPAELRSALRSALPAIMVPSAIIALDQFPRTPNGKIDRKALRPPDDAERAVAAGPTPSTPLEEEVAAVWRRLLGLSVVGTTDDFFELGGNSLLAMRMLAEIERFANRRLSFQPFFEQPTIQSVVTLLLSAVRAEERSGPVVLQASSAGPPFAFVHGDVLGHGWYCRRLAPLLGPQPLVVLPTARPDDANCASSTEEMAAAHIAALRQIQPTGPYRLGGFCQGGIVAYEMARQLRAAGDTVERLILVDAFCANLALHRWRRLVGLLTEAREPTATLERRARLLREIQYRRQRIRQMRQRSLADQLHWIGRVLRRFVGAGAPPRAAGTPAQGDVDGLAMGQDLRKVLAETQAAFAFIARAQRAHIPGPYDGVVDLIWAADAIAARPWLDPTGGWRHVARSVRIHTAPGGHVHLVTPDGLPDLAAALRACLATEAV